MTYFYDSFTEAANTTLADHIPDTGSSWTKQTDNGATLGVIAATDTLKATAGGTNQGALYLANATYSLNSYAIEATLTTAGQAGETIALVGRWQDDNTFYYALYSKPKSCGASSGRCDICKWASGSVITLAQNLEGPVANGSVCRFEIFGTSTVRLRSYVNGILKASADDTATNRITGIGKAGLGIGDFGIAISSGNTGAQEVDGFGVSEILFLEATGGIVIGGNADVQAAKNFSGSGSMTLGGTVAPKFSYSHVGSGGIAAAGSATLRNVSKFTASGSLTLTGSMGEQGGAQSFAASGGMTLGGEATRELVANYLPSGGLVLGWDALFWAPIPFFASGTLTLAGESTATITTSFVGSGGLALSGTANGALDEFIASGGMTLSGSVPIDSMTLHYRPTVAMFGSLMEQNRRIIVGPSGLSEDLVDFPILAGALYATDSSGNDLRIYDEDGNELPYQLLIVSGSPTALGIVWVKTTWKRDKTIELLFHSKQGNVAESLENPAGVWSSYVGAYELGEDGSGQADEFFDGSPVENHGQGGSGNNCPTRVAGYLWDGQRFDGNAFIRLGDDTIEVTDPITFTALFAKLVSSPVGNTPIYSRGRTEPIIGKGWNFQVSITAHRKLQAKVQVVVDEEWQVITTTGGTSLVVGTTYCLHAVWEPGESLRVYINGVLDGETESTATELVPTSPIAHIGRLDDSYLRDVDLDCIRIAKFARSPMWIQGEAKMPVLGITNQTFGRLDRALSLAGVTTRHLIANFLPSGSLNAGGTASVALVSLIAGSGTLTLAGEADFTLNRILSTSGSLALAGEAAYDASFTFRPIGSLVMHGSAPLTTKKDFHSSGALHLAGSSKPRIVTTFTPAGTLTLSSSATTKLANRFAGNGSLTLSGNVPPAWEYDFASAGKLNLTGTAPRAIAKTFTPSGKIEIKGSSRTQLANRFNATGSLALAGATGGSLKPHIRGQGGVQVSGSSLASINASFMGNGSLVLAGQGTLATREGSGSVTLGGAATVFGSDFRFSYEGEGGLTLNPKVATRLEGSIYLATPFVGEWRIEPPHRGAIWLGTPLDGAIDII